jgi:hypothetical protein
MKRFLESMGLDPMLSETPAFPVNPQTSPVQSCLQAVKERADIFVLIVGNRYGSQDENGRSVTNMEYLEAKAKGVPVYVFVLKQILAVLPVWKKNPQADYSQTVDSPKLFEFVEALKSSQEHWMFPFDEAGQIMDQLRRQLAYLFMESLMLRERIKGLSLPQSLMSLSGKSLRILLEKPLGWEHLLLASVASDEMDRDQELKWDLKYAMTIGEVYPLNDMHQMVDWIGRKLRDISALGPSAERLMNQAVQDAMRKPGESGDPEHIVYCARRLAGIRKEALKWTLEFRRAEVQPGCERLLLLLSGMSKECIEEIEGFPSRLESEIAKATQAYRNGQEYTANVQLTLRSTFSEEIQTEFENVRNLAENL